MMSTLSHCFLWILIWKFSKIILFWNFDHYCQCCISTTHPPPIFKTCISSNYFIFSSNTLPHQRGVIYTSISQSVTITESVIGCGHDVVPLGQTRARLPDLDFTCINSTLQKDKRACRGHRDLIWSLTTAAVMGTSHHASQYPKW